MSMNLTNQGNCNKTLCTLTTTTTTFVARSLDRCVWGEMIRILIPRDWRTLCTSSLLNETKKDNPYVICKNTLKSRVACIYF
jgi:hypothetical protein